LAPGLGDHAYPELGTPSNAALVDACVQRARAHGREPATPDQVRRRLQLPAVPA
jgi:uncharacterized protein (DUF849 family)